MLLPTGLAWPGGLDGSTWGQVRALSAQLFPQTKPRPQALLEASQTCICHLLLLNNSPQTFVTGRSCAACGLTHVSGGDCREASTCSCLCSCVGLPQRGAGKAGIKSP